MPNPKLSVGRVGGCSNRPRMNSILVSPAIGLRMTTVADYPRRAERDLDRLRAGRSA
jgi:hypothetical protein